MPTFTSTFSITQWCLSTIDGQWICWSMLT